MVTHGLLRTHRGRVVQGAGKIGCTGAQEVTGTHIRARMVTGVCQNKKVTTPTGPERQQKQHLIHS